VGIGVASPTETLHVEGSSGQTSVLIRELSGTEAARTILELVNNGPGYLRMTDTSPDGGGGWTFQPEGPSLRLNKAGTGAAEVILRGRMDAGGLATMQVDGSIQATNVVFSSSRALKTGFQPLDPRSVLEKISGLQISEWSFIDDKSGHRHIGPIAEDFAAAFDLGGNGKQISLIDASGVALAAVQGLYSELQEKSVILDELATQNAGLAAQNALLTERLQALESAIARLSEN
jgi:hypothetical protein